VIGPLAVATLVALGALALFGLALTAVNRTPGRELRWALWAVVALLAVQAVIAGYRSLGAHLPEQSTFLIYLVVTVCVPWVAGNFAFAEPTRWSGAVVAAGAIATLVAVLRLQGLWAAGG
jgi:hypothetical protein